MVLLDGAAFGALGANRGGAVEKLTCLALCPHKILGWILHPELYEFPLF